MRHLIGLALFLTAILVLIVVLAAIAYIARPFGVLIVAPAAIAWLIAWASVVNWAEDRLPDSMSLR